MERPDGIRPELAYRLHIEKGTRGTVQTLGEMARLAREAAEDPLFVAWIRTRIAEAGIQGRDYEGELRALFEYVRSHIQYRLDPMTLEWLQTPHWTLFVSGDGDCDDMATLICAGALSLGHGCRFRVVQADPARPGDYSHVYAVVGFRDRRGGGVYWIAADATQSHPFGWEPPPERISGASDFPVADV